MDSCTKLGCLVFGLSVFTGCGSYAYLANMKSQSNENIITASNENTSVKFNPLDNFLSISNNTDNDISLDKQDVFIEFDSPAKEIRLVVADWNKIKTQCVYELSAMATLSSSGKNQNAAQFDSLHSFPWGNIPKGTNVEGYLKLNYSKDPNWGLGKDIAASGKTNIPARLVIRLVGKANISYEMPINSYWTIKTSEDSLHLGSQCPSCIYNK